MVDALRPKVWKLLEYLRRFENQDGLLEKLESWVFVEWSAANSFVQDVNYPTNMLYAGTLAAAGRIYGASDLLLRAERVRETIRKQSWDGTFFRDHAKRSDGRLNVRPDRTETCQYYAFFFDVATSESHPELWAKLRDEFGPRRAKTKACPDVHVSNMFIGNVLRMELLSRHGRGQQILDEAVDSLMYMVDQTGTLWENVGATASCNHGFASHIVHTLYRDILGAQRIDPVRRRVLVRIQDARLDWCAGRIPTPDGPLVLRWRRDGGRIAYRVDPPAGYVVRVENISGRELVRQP